ncbi:MAG: YdcF family protein [Crocinitomicaceae bacterium]
MFFLLSKLLLFLTQPFIWILFLLTAGLIWRKKKFSKALLWLAFSFYLFFSNSVIYLEFARLWEIQGKKTENLKTYDCGVLLTGMGFYNHDLDRLSLNVNGDRIWQTLDLYHKGKIRKILITGDSGQISDRGLHEAEQLAEVIRKWGIPAKDIIVESKSQNTNENAEFTTDLLKKSFPELKSILLISSSFHMRRALACFEKRGLSCDSFSTNNDSGPKRNYYWEQYFLPSSQILFYWERLTKEWFGYVMYWVAGYV